VAALDFGRLVRVRGAEVYALGRKEVNRLATVGIDVSEYEGVQVICAADGSVMTVYRNLDFRGLRPRSRPRIGRRNSLPRFGGFLMS